MSIFVLCWKTDCRVDESFGGLGFTLHQTPEAVREWAEDHKKVAKAAELETYMVPSVCGRGIIEVPNEETLGLFGISFKEGGIFTEKIPTGFKLTLGKSPAEVDDEYERSEEPFVEAD